MPNVPHFGKPPPALDPGPVLLSPWLTGLVRLSCAHSRHRDVPAAAAQLHLLARHGQVGEPAAGLAGAVGTLGGQVLGGDLGAQGLQLALIVDLQGTGRAGSGSLPTALPRPLANGAQDLCGHVGM